MSEFIERLVQDFSDKEFAHGYMESHLVSRIAAQIHTLRKQRNWSQAELAERAGITQERVSKIESADFSSLTLKSLFKFSEAFDVALHVGYVSFGEGILDVANLSQEGLRVEEREASLERMKHHTRLVLEAEQWHAVTKVNPSFGKKQRATSQVQEQPTVRMEVITDCRIQDDWIPLQKAC